jgi:hypothetical protein
MNVLVNKEDAVLVLSSEATLNKALDLFAQGLVRNNGVKSLRNERETRHHAHPLSKHEHPSKTSDCTSPMSDTTSSSFTTAAFTPSMSRKNVSMSVRSVQIHPLSSEEASPSL